MGLRVRIALTGLAALAALGSCAPRPAPPAPVPAPQPAPPPAPPPPAPAPDWPDAELAAGDWAYAEEAGGTAASFGVGAPRFVLRCEAMRVVRLFVAGASGTGIVVRTSSGDRSLPAVLQPGGIAASVSAADPLLDAIAFSRGRFAVEADGVGRLVLPAWPEPARVIEDCRG